MTKDLPPLPTVEEILGGATQAGVARPAFLRDDEDDGTVQRVGSSPVAPVTVPVSDRQPSRWTAIKQLLRIIFGGKVDQ